MTCTVTTINKQSWSIVVFGYNEAGTLASVIESVQGFFKAIDCTDNEIVVVDDGSADGSREITRQAAATFSNIKAVYHPRNLGIGRALRSGYAVVQHENVCAVPADGQFDVAELIPYASVPDNTFVSFYRKENAYYPTARTFLSFINKTLNTALIGMTLRDVNWVKIYKRRELQQLDLRMTSSLVESEVCAKLISRQARVVEAESVYHRRRAGLSKGASFKIVMQAVREMSKLVWVVSLYRMKRKSDVNDAIRISTAR